MMDRIRANDVNLKELSLARGLELADVSELLDALGSNNTIESVVMDGAFMQGLSLENRRDLIWSVARLSSIKKVGLSGGRVSVDHLQELLAYARGLTVLNLEQVVLEGEQAEFSSFQLSLFRHRSLQEFAMEDFTLSGCNATYIEDMVKVLPLIPSLRVVKIQARQGDNATLAGSSLSSLLARSKWIEQLRISQFVLDPQSVPRLAKAAAASKSLRTLSLVHVWLDDAGAAHLGAALEGGECSLRELDLSMNDIGDEGCIALAKCLRHNKTIGTLRLTGNKNIGDEGLAAMAAMVDNNNVLKHLEMPATNSAYRGKALEGQKRATVVKRNAAMAA